MTDASFWLALAGAAVPTAAVIIAAVLQYRANRDAHKAIGERIADVDSRAERRAEAFERRMDAQTARIDAQTETLHAIAREVSFLAGRQAERDRRPHEGEAGNR